MKFVNNKKYFLLLSSLFLLLISIFLIILFFMNNNGYIATKNKNKFVAISSQGHSVVVIRTFSEVIKKDMKPKEKPTDKKSDNSEKFPEKSENPQAGTDKKDTQPSKAADKPQLNQSKVKIAYLTFDDGPSEETTPKVLDILDKFNIKATFFVIGNNAIKYSDILKKSYDRGHAIGNHTYSHDIEYYSIKPENMVTDFYKGEDTLKSILPDYKSKLARIPGGSLRWNISYRNAVKAAGFHAVDWNCLSKDAEGANVPQAVLLDNIKRTSKEKDTLIVLMHDSAGKETTVQSLPDVIEYLKAEGYTFDVLN